MSLADRDLKFLDQYAKQAGLASRSAALHEAVRLLRTSELSRAYAAAWGEFDERGDAALWETTVGDGIES